MGRVDAAYQLQATFEASAAVSNALDISRLSPRGLSLLVPNGWTAADIGFQITTQEEAPTSRAATLTKRQR